MIEGGAALTVPLLFCAAVCDSGIIPPFVYSEEMRTMTPILTVKIDAKGRFTIPRQVREELSIAPGDTFFLEVDDMRGVLRFAKAENPFGILAEHAVAEYRAGRTKNLHDFATENAIALDDE
jgi:AbrB family looped-hinge helix DNA binding protein